MPFSVRLDPETEATIRRLSAATARSKSQVVREAVGHYAAEADFPNAAKQSAFDRLKPFIGTVRTGGANYSKDTHRKYWDLIRQKQRAGVHVDASGLIALLDRGDAAHERTVEAVKGVRGPLSTVWPALTEAMHLLADSPRGA